MLSLDIVLKINSDSSLISSWHEQKLTVTFGWKRLTTEIENRTSNDADESAEIVKKRKKTILYTICAVIVCAVCNVWLKVLPAAMKRDEKASGKQLVSSVVRRCENYGALRTMERLR